MTSPVSCVMGVGEVEFGDIQCEHLASGSLLMSGLHDICFGRKKSKERLDLLLCSVCELVISISDCKSNVNVNPCCFVSEREFY